MALSLSEALGLQVQPNEYLAPLNMGVSNRNKALQGALKGKKATDTIDFSDTIKLVSPDKYHKVDQAEAFSLVNNTLNELLNLKNANELTYSNQAPTVLLDLKKNLAAVEARSRDRFTFQNAFNKGAYAGDKDADLYNQYLNSGDEKHYAQISPSVFGAVSGKNDNEKFAIMRAPLPDQFSKSGLQRFINTNIYNAPNERVIGKSADGKQDIVEKFFDEEDVKNKTMLNLMDNADFERALLAGKENEFFSYLGKKTGITRDQVMADNSLLDTPEAMNARDEFLMTEDIYKRAPVGTKLKGRGSINIYNNPNSPVSNKDVVGSGPFVYRFGAITESGAVKEVEGEAQESYTYPTTVIQSVITPSMIDQSTAEKVGGSGLIKLNTSQIVVDMVYKKGVKGVNDNDLSGRLVAPESRERMKNSGKVEYIPLVLGSTIPDDRGDYSSIYAPASEIINHAQYLSESGKDDKAILDAKNTAARDLANKLNKQLSQPKKATSEKGTSTGKKKIQGF